MARRLVTLRPETNIYQAVDLLIDRAISGAPVVDSSGALVGVLSEKDCMQVLTRSAFEDLPSDVTVGDLMSKDPVTVRDDQAVIHAAEIFLSKAFRRLPVLNQKGDLVGQLSRRDVLKAIQMMAVRSKPGDRYLTPAQDPTQAGSMITEGKSARDEVVGPEANKRFQ